jgi:hypothetical protein
LNTVIGDEFMKKILTLPLLFLIILLNTTTVHSSPSLSSKDIISISTEVLDSMLQDQTVLRDKSYIAIDLGTEPFKTLSASEKLQVLNYMKKYDINHINVIASSINDLKKKGMFDKDNNLNFNGIQGIHLSITSMDIIKNNEVSVLGSWYCGPKSTQDVKVILINTEGRWKVKEITKMKV